MYINTAEHVNFTHVAASDAGRACNYFVINTGHIFREAKHTTWFHSQTARFLKSALAHPSRSFKLLSSITIPPTSILRWTMDPDQHAEPELDSFSVYFPLPYRVAVILVLGMRPCG